MGFEVFIVPLIALVVWILQTVLKNPEEEAKNKPKPQPGAPRPQAPRPRKPVTDLDRFLEETRRRRTEDGPVVMAEVVPEPIVERPKPPPPRPRPSRQEKPRPRPVPPPPEPPRRNLRDEPQPVKPETVQEPTPAGELPRMSARTEGPMALEARVAAARVARPSQHSRPATPFQQALMGVIKSRQGAALAIVMHEIFEPPISQRRRQ